jgi:hypothetical protein
VSIKKISKFALAVACGSQLALPQSSIASPAEKNKAELKNQDFKEKPELVKASIRIEAPREVVWQAVHDERKHDPDLAYSKVIVPGEHEYVLEQKIVLIPNQLANRKIVPKLPGSRMSSKYKLKLLLKFIFFFFFRFF